MKGTTTFMPGNPDSLAATFFETAAMPLALLDRGGTILLLNGAWKTVVAEPSAAVGKPLSSLLEHGYAQRAHSILEGLTGDAPKTFVATVAAAGATGRAPRPMRFHLTLDAGTETIQVFAVEASADEDLSERKNLKLKLFSHVIDSASLIVWAIDADGNTTMSEGKGLELLGMTAGSTVGQNVFDLYKDTPEILGSVVRALGGEEIREVASLGMVHLESWLLPIRQPDGSISGVIGFCMDATERVTSERDVREKLELIGRQSATIRALATPIIQIWDEVLCLPVIGTVDSARTADMMQGLLESIVREQARYAIVDLTGVEVVDTSTADHLIRLFRAAKVLGVDGILCGIRPAVAQTVVALGLDLASVRTMRSLRDALVWCIRTKANARAKRNEDLDATTHGSLTAPERRLR
jgi:rsbT co-antagonist protein RsbR